MNAHYQTPNTAITALISALCLVLLCLCVGCGHESSGPARPKLVDGTEFPESLEELLEIRNDWDKHYFPVEVEARNADGVIAVLWDELNRESDDWSSLHRSLANTQIQIAPQKPGGSPESFSGSDWIARMKKTGISLDSLTLRQEKFTIQSHANSRVSHVHGVIHLNDQESGDRMIVNAEFEIEWAGTSGELDWNRAIIRELNTGVQRSSDPVAFRQVVSAQLEPLRRHGLIGPLIVQDINRDGFPEILLPGANRVYWNASGTSFRPDKLLKFPRPSLDASILLTLKEDGRFSLVSVDRAGLWMWDQDERFQFSRPPELGWRAPENLMGAHALTAGDFDRDGLMDLWLGQYKPPYDGGQMPQPIHDANDGQPWFLLKQTSKGMFVDVTSQAGSDALRNRRAFAGSFVDLDLDGWLDLIITSDFAGLDVYWNSGDGFFELGNEELGDQRYALGMSHVVTDANGNGYPEVFLIGMNVPTVDRLIAGDEKPIGGSANENGRSLVSRGNQWMEFLPDRSLSGFMPSGEWKKTGWSWGVTQHDYNNDGVWDYFITNGHESGRTTREYESYFWTYDIYFAGSEPNPVSDAYFRMAIGETRGAGWSYGGYEMNRHLVGGGGDATLTEANFFTGLSHQMDSRAVVSADLNLDGVDDMIVTTLEFLPDMTQRLLVFGGQELSDSDDNGQWGGVHLNMGDAPPGSLVSLVAGDGAEEVVLQNKWLILGESYRSQHPWTIKFGLGNRNHQKYHVVITKPNGELGEKFTLPRGSYLTPPSMPERKSEE